MYPIQLFPRFGNYDVRTGRTPKSVNADRLPVTITTETVVSGSSAMSLRELTHEVKTHVSNCANRIKTFQIDGAKAFAVLITGETLHAIEDEVALRGTVDRGGSMANCMDRGESERLFIAIEGKALHDAPALSYDATQDQLDIQQAFNVEGASEQTTSWALYALPTTEVVLDPAPDDAYYIRATIGANTRFKTNSA